MLYSEQAESAITSEERRRARHRRATNPVAYRAMLDKKNAVMRAKRAADANKESHKQKLRRRYDRDSELFSKICCRFDKDEGDALKDRAKREGVSVCELIRRYVTWGIETEDAG